MVRFLTRSSSRMALAMLILAALAPAGARVLAQAGASSGIPDPVPPPLPPRPKPESARGYQAILPESDAPWELDRDLLDRLYESAALYQDYTRRFTCNETARLADYDGAGNVASEKVRRYAYLLINDELGQSPREYRQRLTSDGSLREGEIKDPEPFPPAYSWVFLFSRFNEPYFAYRLVDDRFDGFDWVYEIHFKGSLPFTHGRDIRQWEGRILVDAVTHTPLEIEAEPAGQKDRIEALYRQWSSSFNFLNQRTGPKPLGYRAFIQFRYRRDDLSFPTELRYDTFRAVTRNEIARISSSTRTYSEYRIFTPSIRGEVGGAARP